MSSEIEGAWDRSTETGNAGPQVRRVDARGSATIVLLAAISTVTSLVNGFAYDDRLLILNNPRVHRLAHIGRVWTQTYWPPWMGAGLYRPLTMSAFVTEWWIGHGAPWVFHATNVALYIVVCLLVYRLAKLQLPPAGAWVAAALFAVHPVHVEAVGNVVGQSELWAACGTLAAVIALVHWRRSAVARASWCTRPTLDGVGDTAPRLLRLATPLGRGLGAEDLGGVRHQLVLVALVIGACLAKEHAVVTPALLVLAEVFLVDDPRPWRDRWRALRPFVLLLSLAVVSYVVVRAHVIGSWAGDRPNVVLEHLSAAARRWTMLGVVSEWTRLLMWPWRLVVEYAPRDITIHEHFEPSLMPNAVLLALILTLVVIAVRRRALAGFALLWIVVTLLLVSNLIVPTGILLAERTLFLPSVGAALLIGDAVTRLTARFGTAPVSSRAMHARWRHLAVAAGIGMLLVVWAWRSAQRQLVWRSNATVFARAPLDAPLSYRAHDVYAGLLFDRGDKIGGEREARIALALYPHDPVLYRDLAQEYMRAGMCTPAIPLLRRSIEEPASVETDAHLLLAECLLAEHDPSSARAEVLRGVAQGPYVYYGAGYHKVLIAIDSATGGPQGLRGSVAGARAAAGGAEPAPAAASVSLHPAR